MSRAREPVSHVLVENCPIQWLRFECGMPADRAPKGDLIAPSRWSATCPGCKAVVDQEPRPTYGAPESMRAYVEWANGGDSGISSATMLGAITGHNFLNDGRVGSYRWRPDVPHDPGDFGRCYRLLERFPELRPQLHKVAEKHPEWARLVERWAELEAMYRAAIESGADEAPELYEAIQEATGHA
jgi:hypothetical protein